jgi:hypothetical protein
MLKNFGQPFSRVGTILGRVGMFPLPMFTANTPSLSSFIKRYLHTLAIGDFDVGDCTSL